MPKDRLKELQQTTSRPHVSYHQTYGIHDVVRDSIMPFTTIDIHVDDDAVELLRVADKIEELSKEVDKIEELSKDIERIHKDMLEPMADSKLGLEVDDKTADIKKLAFNVFTKLNEMEHAQEAGKDKVKDVGQWRITALQIFNMTRRFHEAMNQYNLEFLFHRERCKKSFMHELKISGNKMTDDEVEQIIQTGFPGTFSFSIMVDIAQAKQAANQIEARHRDITKLEESIIELHEMFADLARLVTTQGEMIDDIEHTVLTAKDYVEKGKENTVVVVEGQTKARKRTRCVVITVVVIVFILILIITSYITIKKNIIGR